MAFIDEELFDQMWNPDLEQEELVTSLERHWKRGKHKDQNGKVWNIKDMTTFHLENTIHMFKGIAKVSRLLKELKNRTLC